MVRAEQKVNDLLAEDSGMSDALSAVLAEAEQNGGTVEWADVNGELTSGQWGRIIEKGLLQSANGNGFAVQQPETIKGALNGQFNASTSNASNGSTSADDSDEDSSWTTYDKLAGLVALGMMAGYSIQPIKNTVGGIMHMLLGPVNAVLPFYGVVLLLAVALGFYSTVFRAKLMDTEMMGDHQEKMKDLQDRQKAARERGDDEAIERLQKEQMDMMGDQLGMFKQQFRPMVWIMLLTIPVFLWLYWMIGPGPLPAGDTTVIMPFAGKVAWTDSLLVFPAWLAWYMICSIGSTQVIQKGLNMDITPGS